MKATIITKEYPPHVYGGAGVHVRFLAQELAKRIQVEVRCFGEQQRDQGNLKVRGYQSWERMWEGNERRYNSVLGTFATDLSIVRDTMDCDVVHTHTWYAAWAGCLARELWHVPLVCTVHSLEPLRPWKQEQLGRSYGLSSWAERTALESAQRVIAVSQHARADILRHFRIAPERVRVIYNGVDPDIFKPTATDETRRAYDIGPDYILFVGRASRQKGMTHLIDAVADLQPGVQCVCCTSSPDTKEIEDEIAAKVANQPRIVWINSLLREDQYVELYSNAKVFVCPSIYEPFGIINLEAMSCETPVVGSATGGILESVVDGETGILVEPGNAKAIAEAVNALLQNPTLAHTYGHNGRKRVQRLFSWSAIAGQVEDLYREVSAEWQATGSESAPPSPDGS